MSGPERSARRPGGPVAVFGCGLIGASVAAGLSRAGETVWGCDRRDLAPLVERGWIVRQVPPERLADAEVVVLALPPSQVAGALRRFPFRAGQLVTDTASVKGSILEAADDLAPGVSFVGGHPMAGGTGNGFEAARPDLFDGAVWVLCPRRGGEPDALARAEALVDRLGAEPVRCEAAHHDRLVALTSHVPQLLSTALAAELAATGDPLANRLLGPGGRGFLRLAGSPYELWREILAANREAVAAALAAVSGRAAQPVEAMEDDFRAGRRLIEELGSEPGGSEPS